MFMIVAGMFIVILFMAIFSEIYQDNLKSKKRIIFEDFGYSIQNELILASQVQPGYRRAIYLSGSLDGYEYTVNISHMTLVIDYTDNTFALPIPNITGNFVPGTNIITNKDNKVFLN
jgi:hypothetical protein